MLVQFNLDSGANIHSNKRSGWLSTTKDLGFDAGEWEKLTDDEKWKYAEDWAGEYIEIYYEEKEE